MKKFILLAFGALLLFFLPSPGLAQSTKVITLTDGTVIKGNLIGVKDGEYIIESPTIGEIKVKEAEIESIQSEIAYKIQQQSKEQTEAPAQDQENTGLKEQVNSLQGQVLADPKIMDDIQKLMQNEEIMTILKDPSLMNDVMSFDQDKIQNNEKVKELMDNPQMQEIMNSVQQKMLQDQ